MLAALSDERLVDEVRRGNAAAFELLYDRHSAGILGFCRHMLRSADDAEDAVQHTFIAAHADIGRRGERDLHVKAWLYTIARNRCLSMLRARREIPTDDGIEIVTDRLAQDVQQREDLRELLADVHKLPDDQREALILAEVGDLPHEEIAGVLGCEASKVKSLVFQARSALIDRRLGRETSCEQIREQIATLRGGALRRSYLRHHLEACPGCSEYRDEVRRQRAMLAIALPVVPSAALKAHVLGGLGLGGGSAAVASVGAGATGAGLATQGGIAAKLGIVAVLALGGGTAAVVQNGGVPLMHDSGTPAAHDASSTKGNAGSLAAHTTAGRSTPTTTTAPGKHGTTTGHHPKSATTHRSPSGDEHGFTPTTGGSNGEAARQFAQTRGQGKHLGLTKTRTKGHANRGRAHAKHTAPAHSKPVPKPHPAPAPKAQVPTTKAQPAPQKQTSTQTEPAPTTTGTTATPAPAPAPNGGNGSLGKSLGSDAPGSSG